mmetsp:Transcript_30126/g.76106  ORF Transcript_30126/g.76106 Transcript_30126/m.76106 type:complete len:249 (+) Transcript_30126:39-785(+)
MAPDICVELSPGLLETYMERFELKKEAILEQKSAFDLIDDNRSGCISMEELRKFNATFNGGFTEEELQDHFKEMDRDSSGGITFLEYLKVYVKGEFGREVHIGLEHLETAPKDLVVTPRSAARSRGASLDMVRSPSGLAPIREQSSSRIAEDRPEGFVDMKLSSRNGVAFYARAARLFLRGAEGKEPVAGLRVLALGDAIGTAAALAARVESEGLGRVTALQTAYPEMPPSGRGCAQISIDIERISDP